MGNTVASIRASTDKQDLYNQKLEILEFTRQKGLTVDEFIEIAVSSQETNKQRHIDELLAKLSDSNTLIVTELSRLGRSTSEVIALINELIQRDIRVIVSKQNLDIVYQEPPAAQQQAGLGSGDNPILSRVLQLGRSKAECLKWLMLALRKQINV
jgi:hypothetical protein